MPAAHEVISTSREPTGWKRDTKSWLEPILIVTPKNSASHSSNMERPPGLLESEWSPKAPWDVHKWLLRGDTPTHKFALVTSGLSGGPGGSVMLVTTQSTLITPHSLGSPGSLWPCCPCCLHDRESTHLRLEDAGHVWKPELCHPLTVAP